MTHVSRFSLRNILSAIFVFTFLLTACAPAMSAYPEREALDAAPPAAPVELSVVSTYAVEESAGSGNFQSPPADTERLVIKNGNLSIVVDDPSGSVDRISRMAEEMGGFVVSANLYQSELENGAPVWRGSVIIRVPAERLNDALEKIKSESTQDPISENVTSQDVTSEYTDLESRLGNLEAAEEQLTRIMESAVKTEDVLNVYNQLVQTREQIEVIKGQMKYYEQSAAMSAVSVELIPNEAVQQLSIGGWQPVGVVKDAVQGLIDTLKVIANIFIWVLLFVVPVLAVLFILFVLPLILIFRALRRRRAHRKEAAVVEKTAE
ncbi:MAG: hypothetical protein A2Z16_06200 [Chloroflexi bacterium RBG_16_54_18]|nr:MAG: hypothetical protein A2Z16_06200 [Chloroflexi bacterium RBG_16_54_18]